MKQVLACKIHCKLGQLSNLRSEWFCIQLLGTKVASVIHLRIRHELNSALLFHVTLLCK